MIGVSITRTGKNNGERSLKVDADAPTFEPEIDVRDINLQDCIGQTAFADFTSRACIAGGKEIMQKMSEKQKWHQYETAELSFRGPAPEGSEAVTDLSAVFSFAGFPAGQIGAAGAEPAGAMTTCTVGSGNEDSGDISVRGFYAGDGVWKVRFLPERTGVWRFAVSGVVNAAGEAEVLPAREGQHGPVRADGEHFRYADGTWFYPFGTTVYALAHQTEALMDETIETIAASPFNKVRMCLFPKDYLYNHNEPRYYAFREHGAQNPEGGCGEGAFCAARDDGQSDSARDGGYPKDNWDVDHPDFRFWDAFEDKIRRLGALGVEVDLILFHPYDRWGFARLAQKDNLVYLDYLLRRFAAFPNVWWSLANEYDLCAAKTMDDWAGIEQFIAEHDPYRHLMSSHNCFHWYDASRPRITHSSLQTKQMGLVSVQRSRTHKPVIDDECCYEGNLDQFWGCLSGQELTERFWEAVADGGYCTHGEVFLRVKPEDEKDAVLWWAKGGKLYGESPKRIAWLRKITESLGGPIDPAVCWMTERHELVDRLRRGEPVTEEERESVRPMMAITDEEWAHMQVCDHIFAGHVGDHAFLWYLEQHACGHFNITLPEGESGTVSGNGGAENGTPDGGGRESAGSGADGASSGYRVEVLDTWEMTRTTVLEHVSGTVRVPLPGKCYMAILATKED